MDSANLSTHAVEISKDPFCHQPCLGRVGPRVPGAGLHVTLRLHVSKGIHQRKDTWKADLRQLRRLSRRKDVKEAAAFLMADQHLSSQLTKLLLKLWKMHIFTVSVHTVRYLLPKVSSSHLKKQVVLLWAGNQGAICQNQDTEGGMIFFFLNHIKTGKLFFKIREAPQQLLIQSKKHIIKHNIHIRKIVFYFLNKIFDHKASLMRDDSLRKPC